MPLTIKQIRRVLKWLPPKLQEELRAKYPELPAKGRSYCLKLEDLLLIEELTGEPLIKDAYRPLLSVPPKSAEIIPFKPK